MFARAQLTKKTEELHAHLDGLKHNRKRLADELERLRFEEGEHLDPTARPEHTEAKEDQQEMQVRETQWETQ